MSTRLTREDNQPSLPEFNETWQVIPGFRNYFYLLLNQQQLFCLPKTDLQTVQVSFNSRSVGLVSLPFACE